MANQPFQPPTDEMAKKLSNAGRTKANTTTHSKRATTPQPAITRKLRSTSAPTKPAPAASKSAQSDKQASIGGHDAPADKQANPIAASAFERASSRSAYNSAASSNGEEGDSSGSESDSQEIIVPPTSQPVEAAASAVAYTTSAASSSELSDLDDTPEPPDPELERVAHDERMRQLDPCVCEGWCYCERYKLFYGFAPVAVGVEVTNLDFLADAATGSNSTNKQESAAEYPSQTHLSERVLAIEEFPESAMRSTISKGTRAREVHEEEQLVPNRRSWERQAKPARPPFGWVGGQW
jgi:hypothetical protein